MPNTRLTNAKWKRILEFLRSDSSVYVKDEAECSKFIELADKGYDSDVFREYVAQSGATAVIPPRSNRKRRYWYDEHIYKERHLVECFFNKVKQFRRVFSRFDKLADAYLSFIHIEATLIWLK